MMNTLSTSEILKRYIEDCASVDQEYLHEPLHLRSGQIPSDLRGYLLRNGAGRFENYGIRYQHPFDGDGMISSFFFENGEVRYSNRFVRTEEFKKEAKKGKMCYRSLGTNLPGGILQNFGKLKVKNAANTSVVYHGGKLLALWEGGLPHEIAPDNLETRGRYDYQGKLMNQGSWIERYVNPELAFSAHPKLHPGTGDLYNFGMVSGPKNYLATHRVNSSGELVEQNFYPVDNLHFIHDFVLTEDKSQVFFLTAISFDLWKTFLGIKPAIASISGNGKATRVLWIDPEGKTREFETGSGFIFHHANGYRNQDGKIVVDSLKMDAFPDALSAVKMMEDYEFENGGAFLTRYIIHPDRGEIEENRICPLSLELPVINPEYETRAHRYVWAIGAPLERSREMLHAIVKVDVAQEDYLIKDFFPDLPSEPIMVPKKGGAEDEGCLMVLLYKFGLQKTQLLIMDSKSLEVEGVVDLPHCLPLGFHGTWVENW